LEDTYYRVNILEKVVMKVATIPSPLLDPLEACLIVSYGHRMEAAQDEADKACIRILDSTLIYLPRQYQREILNVEV